MGPLSQPVLMRAVARSAPLSSTSSEKCGGANVGWRQRSPPISLRSPDDVPFYVSYFHCLGGKGTAMAIVGLVAALATC
jgi:hypothetical protein